MAVLFFFVVGVGVGYILRMQITLCLMRLRTLATRTRIPVRTQAAAAETSRIKFELGEGERALSAGDKIGYDTLVSADTSSPNLSLMYKIGQEWHVVQTFARLVRLALGNDIQTWLIGVTPEGQVMWSQRGGVQVEGNCWALRILDVPGQIKAIKTGWYQTVLVDTTKGIYEVWLPYGTDADRGAVPSVFRLCDSGFDNFRFIRPGYDGIYVGPNSTMLVRTSDGYVDSGVPAMDVYCLDSKSGLYATLTVCGGSYSTAKPFGWVSVVRVDVQTGGVTVLWDGERNKTVSNGKPVSCLPDASTGHLKSSRWFEGGEGFFLLPPDGTVMFVSGSPDDVLWPEGRATRLNAETGKIEVLWDGSVYPHV